MKRLLLTLASLLGFLTGCAAPSQTLIPTPYPPEYLPTVIAMTADAANAAVAVVEVTPTATEIIPTETLEPTITPSPKPTWTSTTIPGHDFGAIRISAPGPMSKVTSPIQIRSTIITGSSERVQVELFGEDGRLMARELRKLRTTNKGAVFSIKIPFETRATAELGRITISTFDKEGRTSALNSVRVLLLSSGFSEINPSGDPYEPVWVIKPTIGDSVSGGVLNVNGDIWPLSVQPVVLELVGPTGQSLGLRIYTVDTIDPQSFATTIPYKVSEPTSARLVIRQDDDRMSGIFYIYTQEVMLNP